MGLNGGLIWLLMILNQFFFLHYLIQDKGYGNFMEILYYNSNLITYSSIQNEIIQSPCIYPK
jgi:hypothetical protein